MERLKLNIKIEDTKICSRCGQNKFLSEFYKNKNTKDKLTFWCKECSNEYYKQYYFNNKEKYNAQSIQWTKDNRQKHNQNLRKATFKREYGVTIADRNKMYKEQNGCCAICGKHQTEFKNKLSIDHDHSTRKVRSLLCHRCNIGLGNFNDDIELLEKAIEYLNLHKD